VRSPLRAMQPRSPGQRGLRAGSAGLLVGQGCGCCSAPCLQRDHCRTGLGGSAVGKHHITLHHPASPCITLHHPASRCITLHHTTSPCIVLHRAASPCITLHHPASSCITPHHPASPCIILHHAASPCITLHHAASPCITPHHPTSPCITLHPPASHHITLHHPASPCILLHHTSPCVTLHHPASPCILLHPPASSCIVASSQPPHRLSSALANFLTGPPRGHDAPAGTWAQGALPSTRGTWHVCPGISGAPTGVSTQPQKPLRPPMTLSPA